MELSGVTQWAMKMVVNPLIWFILILVFVLGTLGILWLRRKRRLKFWVAEEVDLGSDKSALNMIKGGWFGKKTYLKGLWWTGDEVFRAETGEIVEDFSTEDYMEINGERGVRCYRNPTDQNILVPLNKVHFNNKELVMDIAPSSYRDVALDIIKDSVAETTEWKDKIIQFLGWALIVVFSLIAIIVITQMVKNGQTEASNLIVKAGETCLQNAKDVCSQIATSIRASNAP